MSRGCFPPELVFIWFWLGPRHLSFKSEEDPLSGCWERVVTNLYNRTDGWLVWWVGVWMGWRLFGYYSEKMPLFGLSCKLRLPILVKLRFQDRAKFDNNYQVCIRLAFWSGRSACAARGCWHKRRWPLFLIFFHMLVLFLLPSYLLPQKGLS